MKPLYRRPLIAALSCAALLLPTANASASSYIGLDGSSVSFDYSAEDDVNATGLRLRLGMRVAEGFDIEAHIGGGADNSTQAFDELRASYIGFYLKGYLPVGERSALFALAGGSNVELEQTIGPGKFSDDRAGFSYGFGLETQLSERLDLSADFMRYSLDDDEFSAVSAVNIGLKLYF